MTYTMKDLINVRAAKGEANQALAEAEKAHTDLVAEIRSKGGDAAVFAAENTSRIEAAIETRAKAAAEVTRLSAQEATIGGFLAGAGAPVVREQKLPTSESGDDWAARAVAGELFAAFRQNAQDGSNLMAGLRDREQKLFTREELVSLFQGRAFDAAAGAGLRTPDYKSTRLDVFTRRPRILDYINVGTTDTDVVDWTYETAQTNNAGYVDYGSHTTESAYGFAHTSTSVSRLQAWVSATDGQLSDAGQSATLLRQRLIGALNRFVEGEVYAGDGSGTGVSKHLTGFTVASAANTTSGSGLTPFDAVMEAIVKIQVDSILNLDPMHLIIHPNDYKKTVLEKDNEGRYQVANPTANVIVPIWGLTPIITPLATEGSPWVCDLTEYTLFVREGLALSLSDNVGTAFLDGIKHIKGELRLAGATMRPGAFRQITNFGA